MTEPASKPLLVLDLDETLIHASETRLSIAPEPTFQVGPYHVYQRPWLPEFLTSAASHYRLAIWSAGSDDYVTAIADRILPAGIQFEFVWARSRCVERYHPEFLDRYWVKDLKKVKRRGDDLRRVLIVDDTPRKLERNFGNAIYVRSFEGDPLDQELPRLGIYLAAIADCSDFRKLEKRNWRRAAPDQV